MGATRVERDTTQIDIRYDWVTYNATSRTFTPLNNTHFNSTRFGGLLGYKHFISDELGFRAYFLFDGKFQAGSETNDFKTFNFNLNVDALYNFYTNKQRLSSIGLFVGGSAGGVQHKQGLVIANGTDLALNAGLRTSVGNHSLEFYSRFAFLKADKYLSIYEGTYVSNGKTYAQETLHYEKIRQPYVFGIRYVYSLGF